MTQIPDLPNAQITPAARFTNLYFRPNLRRPQPITVTDFSGLTQATRAAVGLAHTAQLRQLRVDANEDSIALSEDLMALQEQTGPEFFDASFAAAVDNDGVGIEAAMDGENTLLPAAAGEPDLAPQRLQDLRQRVADDPHLPLEKKPTLFRVIQEANGLEIARVGLHLLDENTHLATEFDDGLEPGSKLGFQREPGQMAAQFIRSMQEKYPQLRDRSRADTRAFFSAMRQGTEAWSRKVHALRQEAQKIAGEEHITKGFGELTRHGLSRVRGLASLLAAGQDLASGVLPASIQLSPEQLKRFAESKVDLQAQVGQRLGTWLEKQTQSGIQYKPGEANALKVQILARTIDEALAEVSDPWEQQEVIREHLDLFRDLKIGTVTAENNPVYRDEVGTPYQRKLTDLANVGLQGPGRGALGTVAQPIAARVQPWMDEMREAIQSGNLTEQARLSQERAEMVGSLNFSALLGSHVTEPRREALLRQVNAYLDSGLDQERQVAAQASQAVAQNLFADMVKMPSEEFLEKAMQAFTEGAINQADHQALIEAVTAKISLDSYTRSPTSVYQAEVGIVDNVRAQLADANGGAPSPSNTLVAMPAEEREQLRDTAVAVEAAINKEMAAFWGSLQSDQNLTLQDRIAKMNEHLSKVAPTMRKPLTDLLAGREERRRKAIEMFTDSNQKYLAVRREDLAEAAAVLSPDELQQRFRDNQTQTSGERLEGFFNLDELNNSLFAKTMLQMMDDPNYEELRGDRQAMQVMAGALSNSAERRLRKLVQKEVTKIRTYGFKGQDIYDYGARKGEEFLAQVLGNLDTTPGGAAEAVGLGEAVALKGQTLRAKQIEREAQFFSDSLETLSTGTGSVTGLSLVNTVPGEPGIRSAVPAAVLEAAGRYYDMVSAPEGSLSTPRSRVVWGVDDTPQKIRVARSEMARAGRDAITALDRSKLQKPAKDRRAFEIHKLSAPFVDIFEVVHEGRLTVGDYVIDAAHVRQEDWAPYSVQYLESVDDIEVLEQQPALAKAVAEKLGLPFSLRTDPNTGELLMPVLEQLAGFVTAQRQLIELRVPGNQSPRRIR